MSSPSFDPSAPDFPRSSIDKRRLAFLLSRFSGKAITLADVKKKCASGTGKAMQFDAEKLPEFVQTLEQKHWVSSEKIGRAAKYRLTDKGAELLESLRIYQPPDRSAYLQLPFDNEERHQRCSAAVLLHLFKAKESTQTRKQANDCKSIPGAKIIEISPSIAHLIRQELVEAGFIRWAPLKTQECYTITDAGLMHLTGMSFSFVPTVQLKLSGDQLTKLLAFGRQSNGMVVPSAATPAHFTAPAPEPQSLPSGGELEQAILAAYEHLRREKYSRSNAVPICEVRSEIRERFGQHAASHEVLDPMILKLRTDGRFRLIAMSLSHDTPAEQIRDSVPGYEETFYYMEAVS